MALLALLLAVAAYVDAWSRLPQGATAIGYRPWSDLGVVAIWFLLTAVLGGVTVVNLSKGRRWPNAVPKGYLWSLVACAVLGLSTIVDAYYQLAVGAGSGLEVLLRPTHLVELVAGAVIVAGPLQAALRRGDPQAGLPAIVSSALYVSTIAFATQFLNPLVDLWPARGSLAPSGVPVGWWSQHLGAGSIVLEASLLSASVLLLLRSFEVRVGSFTIVCALQGALLAILKTNWWLVPAPLAAGVVADVALTFLKPTRSRPHAAWVTGALVAMAFATAYLLLLAAAGDLAWDAQLSIGVVLLAGAAGWLIALVLFAVLPAGRDWDDGAAARRGALITAPMVKSALEALNDVHVLATSPLVQLPWIRSEGPAAAVELKAALIKVMSQLASSPDIRDAQTGQILIDYYVKRVGTLELVAERNNVSRNTCYRRRDLGFTDVADRLEDMQELGLGEASTAQLTGGKGPRSN